MRKLFLSLIAISCFLISCEKDPEAAAVPTYHIPVVEGYYATTNAGDLIGVYGEPNTLTMSEDYLISHPFPNPTYSHSSIYILKSPPTFSKGKYWIVPALQKGQELIYPSSNGGQYAFTGGVPITSGVFYKDFPFTHINFQLPPGTYRIYVMCENVLLYDNLIVQQYNQ